MEYDDLARKQKDFKLSRGQALAMLVNLIDALDDDTYDEICDRFNTDDDINLIAYHDILQVFGITQDEISIVLPDED